MFDILYIYYFVKGRPISINRNNFATLGAGYSRSKISLEFGYDAPLAKNRIPYAYITPSLL